MHKRTKIVATLGPATDAPDVLEPLIEAGVDVVRLNFSHGDVATHQARVTAVRACAKAQGRIVGILADLQGPKIRIGAFTSGAVELQSDQIFSLDTQCPMSGGDVQRVNLDYPELIHQVKTGQQLCLSDGKIVLEIVDVTAHAIQTRVQMGGVLKDHQGLNLVGGGLSAGALTDKDRSDLVAACAMGVEYIALSFVKHADDIVDAKQLIASEKAQVHVIAKIERVEAVEHIETILAVADGLMVARGDLAVEVGDAEVPALQKQLISQAKTAAKPVIVATQMMESMIHQPTPTRAEVSDVANAVLDGADAVMLSAETAAGEHPVEAVEAMVRACLGVEQHQPARSKILMEKTLSRVDEAVAIATIFTANRLDIKAIVALTESGRTPLWMSSIQTLIPICALSRHAHTLGWLALYRGVHPVYFDVMTLEHAQVNRSVIQALEAQGWVESGDLVILTKGDHLGQSGGANAMKIIEVGKVR